DYYCYSSDSSGIYGVF
nr:immunoglobulin light chain junction region [Macaca mulatta]MOV99367.1 immunoglobulin light chain junction region [Macaca mulatta]